MGGFTFLQVPLYETSIIILHSELDLRQEYKMSVADVVGVVPRVWAGHFGLQIPAGAIIFRFSKTSIRALRLTQLPIQWIPDFFSPGIKRPGCEVYILQF